MAAPANPDLLTFAAEIVSAQVAHNAVSHEALPGLIRSVYDTLNGLIAEPAPPERLRPAVPIGKSVFPDHIICLEDGKKLKMLKRHLNVSHDMTLDQYRKRWSLPDSYPMVAPMYAAQRSSLAKKFGLGRPPAGSDDFADRQVRKVPGGARSKGAAGKRSS